jgi:putative ABC transport system permease protein
MLSQGNLIGILAIIAFVLCIMLSLFLRTQLGYALGFYGINPHFLERYAISTRMVFMSGVILANGFAGLSGYLTAQAYGFADLNFGMGKILVCLTSLMLGAVITRKLISQRQLIIVPVVGTFCYFSLQIMLVRTGFNITYFTLVQAVIILIVLTTAYRTHILERPAHDALGL